MGQSGLFVTKRRQFLMMILLMFTSLSAMAEQLAGPQQVIQRISDELQTVLMQNQEQMKSDPSFVYQLANDVLIPHVDFGHVSSLVLGKYWRRATDQQKRDVACQVRRRGGRADAGPGGRAGRSTPPPRGRARGSRSSWTRPSRRQLSTRSQPPRASRRPSEPPWPSATVRAPRRERA